MKHISHVQNIEREMSGHLEALAFWPP